MSQLKQEKCDLVGLQYIIEIHANDCNNTTIDGSATSQSSDKDGNGLNMNARYVCVICSRKMDTCTLLVSHLKSLPHKLNYAVSIHLITKSIKCEAGNFGVSGRLTTPVIAV